MKMRFKLVDHEESMGMARKEPSGRAIGARREDSIAAMIKSECFTAMGVEVVINSKVSHRHVHRNASGLCDRYLGVMARDSDDVACQRR